MKEQNSSRRDFIKKSVVGAAAFSIVPRFVLGGQGYLARVII
ncbi:twin-arginine translocation signal domain-containing protein [Sphingobacterium sp. E70]|nr:twin-arginine translocation signal domain-containing protein [Sphingobacterium sp. E70]ULT27843.1 twin-arginine translocation signal domain-containing protein [Sphingobacterium sp. E70]